MLNRVIQDRNIINKNKGKIQRSLRGNNVKPTKKKSNIYLKGKRIKQK